MTEKRQLRDLVHLHFIVAVWGLTAILGKLISLASPVLVAWRTGLAAAGLFCILLAIRRSPWPGARHAARILAVGCVIGVHWMLFFLPGRLGTVSAGLIGISTCSLWCALLEPVFVRGKRLGVLEISLALLAVVGAAVICGGDRVSRPGLLTGMASALVAAIFGFLNDRLVKRYDPKVIALYEMAGACIFMALAGQLFTSPQTTWLPTGSDWIWLLLLSQLCTVYAFTAYVELLKRVSVFTISLVSNLEPVYGIAMAAVAFGEHRQLQSGFWLGAALVICSVLAYPPLVRWKGKRISSVAVVKNP